MPDMPKFVKSPPEVMELAGRLVAGIHCEARKMFGFPAYFIRGNMFAGTFAERLFFRFPAGKRDELLSGYAFLAPFEPLPGRVMKEYLSVRDAAKQDETALLELFTESAAHTAALPEKKKK